MTGLRKWLLVVILPVAVVSTCCVRTPPATIPDSPANTTPAGPTLPPLATHPEYIPGFDIQIVVVDSERGLPVEARFDLVGWPNPLFGTIGVVRTSGAGYLIVAVSAKGFVPQVRTFLPGVHVVVLVRRRVA